MGLENLIYKAERAALFIPMKKSVGNLIAVYEYLTAWYVEGIPKVFSEMHSWRMRGNGDKIHNGKAQFIINEKNPLPSS